MPQPGRWIVRLGVLVSENTKAAMDSLDGNQAASWQSVSIGAHQNAGRAADKHARALARGSKESRMNNDFYFRPTPAALTRNSTVR